MGCSDYSQGCAGGFGYLIAGKYAKDFGFVEESVRPYHGRDGACQKSSYSDATRHHAKTYQFVGGYYGGTNEANMLESLVNDGPITVGFMVFADFMHYGEEYTVTLDSMMDMTHLLLP